MWNSSYQKGQGTVILLVSKTWRFDLLMLFDNISLIYVNKRPQNCYLKLSRISSFPWDQCRPLCVLTRISTVVVFGCVAGQE